MSDQVNDYTAVCEKLDVLAFRILKIMHTIIFEREYLDANLKEGYLDMAKSRFLMRGQKINIFQVDIANLKASKKVTSDTEVIDGVEFLNYEVSVNENKHIRDSKINPPPSSNDRKLIDDMKQCSLSGRKEDDRTCAYEEKQNVTDNKNPLRWFGVLVPESLKNCQSRFEQSIITALKIASLQNQLRSAGEEYRNLLKKKHELRKPQ